MTKEEILQQHAEETDALNQTICELEKTLQEKYVENTALKFKYQQVVEQKCLEELQRILDASDCVLESLPDGRFKVTYNG